MTGSRKTRVLLVIAGLPAGGAERQMVLLAENLRRDAFEVGLLIFNAADKVHYREVFDTPLWFRPLGLSPAKDGLFLVPRLIRGIHRAVTEFAPDVIHTSLNMANHATRFTSLLMRWRIPILTSIRVDYRIGYARHEKLLEWLLWRRSAHVICNTETTRQEIIEDLSIGPRRVSMIANGIDPKFFDAPLTGLPDWWPSGRLALTVGRFKAQKNHLGLIAAISELAKRKALGDWNFVFLGEGPLEHDIRAAIKDMALQDRIVLAPPVFDMPAIYRSSDLFILPSLFEGLPNAMLEAAAGACPIALTPGANEAGIIAEGRGWILEDALSDSLEMVLNLPKEDLVATGRNAARHVRQDFSAEKAVEKTAAIYRLVTESRSLEVPAIAG